VLFLEHKHLLRQPYTRDPYPEAGWVVPIGRAAIDRPGRDLTIVTYGATVERSRQAARQLEEEQGASVEIVDLRYLIPWDQPLIAESVARTSRVLVVHEDIRTAGFGAEVAAWIAEHCFADLDAPVGRVGAQDCHVAYEPSLEHAVLPQASDIAAAARHLLAY
jgi:2-oxoisovalerate dehydrogenase E1 component